MLDCTNVNAAWVAANIPTPDVIAWYGTGSPDIDWTPGDLALFPHSVKAEIDQGGSGSPILAATIRDVESGAWSPGQAVNKAGWNVPRPTIYCNRSTLPSVIADGWRGDIWLAWPGYAGPTAPIFQGVNVVAVQNVFAQRYDGSIIYDPTWPLSTVINPPPEGFGFTIVDRVADLVFGTIPEADHYVIQHAATKLAVPVTVGRVSQPVSGSVVHVIGLMIPGGSNGMLTVWAIVHGRAVMVGTNPLP
jgi:hypothetical protein